MNGKKKGNFLLGFILFFLLFLSACGAQESQSSAEPPAAYATQEAASDAKAPVENTSRTYQDIIGAVEIPAEPNRIVAPYVEDSLITLGVKPAMQWALGDLVQEYLQPHLTDVPRLDFTDGVNMEALIQANPDLIVLYTKNLAENGAYDQFNKIEPTYAFDDATVDWRGTLRKLGQILNKTDVAEKAIQHYDQKVAESKEKLQPYTNGKTVAVIRIKPKEVLLMDGTYYSGPVLYHDLGLQPHKLVRELSWEYHKPLSLEILPELDADYIFLLVQGEAAQVKAKELTDSSIWKGLPAVKNGHVFEVDNTYWMASGAIANEMKIEDVVKHIVAP
ncbi:ABC transporter substrate-binding protein [Brevibacillus reuszeri]|uniref:ABC transporter substrate-binding protein n=1 Tax=Brevibacillus reuszeri TaxID=54915 RepID=UPI000CCC2310|nr:ABC transporter substrate-binding protein [Brevibacillus reuszeri]